MSEDVGTSVARPAPNGQSDRRAAGKANFVLVESARLTRSAGSNEGREESRSTRCENCGVARIVGLDVGERRIGMAVSDVSGTLARPLGVLRISSLDASAVALVASDLTRLAAEDDGLGVVVVGLPRRLDGSPNAMTPRVEAFADALRVRTGHVVVLQDERLTSVEAESRLALRDRDWRTRKDKLDAAAAAVILQDYLDAHSTSREEAEW